MAKIGRNDPCPCGSGKKYKKCCLNKNTSSAAAQSPLAQKISVTDEIVRLQSEAVNKNATTKNIGVFILFSTSKGDAWLLELTAQDAVVVAKGGEKIDVDIDETPETIEINWTHQFSVNKNIFTTTAYSDKVIETHEDYPTDVIAETLKRIQTNYSSDLLDSIHVKE